MRLVLLRHGPLALALVACLLLVLAEFGDLNHIVILTVDRPGIGLGGHHGYAQLIIGLVAAVMAVGAWRGSRPAAIAVTALGIVSLLIVLLVDLPDVDALGEFRNYEGARAALAWGLRLQVLGAILLLFSGVARLVVPRRP